MPLTAKAIGEPLGRANGSPTLSSLYPQTDRRKPGQTLANRCSSLAMYDVNEAFGVRSRRGLTVLLPPIG